MFYIIYNVCIYKGKSINICSVGSLVVMYNAIQMVSVYPPHSVVGILTDLWSYAIFVCESVRFVSWRLYVDGENIMA
jgi:hypothetical protein